MCVWGCAWGGVRVCAFFVLLCSLFMWLWFCWSNVNNDAFFSKPFLCLTDYCLESAALYFPALANECTEHKQVKQSAISFSQKMPAQEEENLKRSCACLCFLSQPTSVHLILPLQRKKNK